MVWQRVVDHVHDQRIVAESKDGNQYPVEVPEDVSETVYSWALGDLAPDEMWVDVDFSGNNPTSDRLSSGHPGGGPPDPPE